LECIEIIRYFIKVIVLIQCLNYNNILTSSKSRKEKYFATDMLIKNDSVDLVGREMSRTGRF
jgi:hypothetical protein